MGWMRRGLLLLAFVFAVLGVHPCDSATDDPGADHAAHHSAVHSHATQDTSQSDGESDCMGGACDMGTREQASEPEAPAVVSDDFVALQPSPLGSLAPGVSDGHLHSGQSPGAEPDRAPDLTLLSVSRT